MEGDHRAVRRAIRRSAARREWRVGRPSVFRVQLVGELLDGGVKPCEEPQDGVPAHAAPPTLDLGDVGRVDAEAAGELLLGDPGLRAQCGERTAELALALGLIDGVGGFWHSATVARPARVRQGTFSQGGRRLRLLGKLVRQVLGCGVHVAQEAHDRVPADASLAVLDSADVAIVHVHAVPELLLGEGRALPKPPQRGAHAGLDLDRIEGLRSLRHGLTVPLPDSARQGNISQVEISVDRLDGSRRGRGMEMKGLPEGSGSRSRTGRSRAWVLTVGLSSIDAVEQLRGRDPEGLAQLGDGADSRLALCALDLRHMTRVQAGFVGHAFLAPASFFSKLLQVRGEDIQRIEHKPHDRWPVPTVPGTIGTGRGLRREHRVVWSSSKNRRTQRPASERRVTSRRDRSAATLAVVSGQRWVRSLYRPRSSTSGATSRPSTRRMSVLSLISRLPRSILEIWTTASLVLPDSSSWVQPRCLRASRTFSPNF